MPLTYFDRGTSGTQLDIIKRPGDRRQFVESGLVGNDGYALGVTTIATDQVLSVR